MTTIPCKASTIDKERMRQMRAAGASLREIAKAFGCSRQYVQQVCPPVPDHLQRQITERRRKEGNLNALAARDDLWTEDEIRILADLWPIWRSGRKIAATGRLNRSASAITQRAIRVGLLDQYRHAPPRRPEISLPVVSILLPRSERNA